MTSKLSLTGLRVLVVGLAREGCAVARFLAEQGAQVAVTDLKSATDLQPEIERLHGQDIQFYLGHHPEALLTPDKTDLLVVSPGVPLTAPFLQQAQAQGLPLTTETRFLCQLCPAPVIGISGSSGKTTTTTLVGLMLQESGYVTHVGGNIGQPLISKLAQIKPQDRVVLELSSFQLEYFHPTPQPQTALPELLKPLSMGWSPQVGALLNITPNHLDRHGSMAAYTEAKLALLSSMGDEQQAILGWDNAVTRQLADDVAAQISWFSIRDSVEHGACLDGSHIALRTPGETRPICPVEAIRLRGEHNITNVLAACAIAAAAGATLEAMQTVVTTFKGVPHRLEEVAVSHGVTYINDSIATSPERLIAALQSFEQPLILLAGGKDKDLPWTEAAQQIRQQVKHLILFGHAADLIDQAVQANRQGNSRLQVHRAGTLAAAVAQAKALAQPGEVVLLSPGGTSFDAYADFAARGEHFRELVLEALGKAYDRKSTD